MTSKNILSAAIALAMLTGVSAAYAQTPCVPTHYKHKKHEPAPAPCDTSDLKKQLDAQQAELDALKAKLAAMTPPAETDPIATPIANKAESDAQSASSSAAAASATATAAQTAADKAAADAAVAKKEADELQTPSAIHYKGVLIQPGGFAAAESVYRSRATNSDIATPFNAIPYMNSNNAFLSEFNGSVRQSRLSLNVTAPMSWGKAGAYFETDFLGAGTTSNNNQTNSYVLRVRSAFGYVTFNNGFTFQGGQMFTLATEDKKGVLAGPGAEASTSAASTACASPRASRAERPALLCPSRVRRSSWRTHRTRRATLSSVALVRAAVSSTRPTTTPPTWPRIFSPRWRLIPRVSATMRSAASCASSVTACTRRPRLWSAAVGLLRRPSIRPRRAAASSPALVFPSPSTSTSA
jgi:hypothetical protein